MLRITSTAVPSSLKIETEENVDITAQFTGLQIRFDPQSGQLIAQLQAVVANLDVQANQE